MNKYIENYELFKQLENETDLDKRKLLEDAIVEKYIPLLHSVALKVIQKFNMVGVEPSELIGYAYKTLVKKINEYDLSKGVSFCVFARQRLYGSIIDELRRNDSIDRGTRERIKKYHLKEQELSHKLNRQATEDEIWSELSKSQTKRARTGKQDYLPVKISSMSTYDIKKETDEILDTSISPENQIDSREFMDKIKTIKLSKKDHDLLTQIAIDGVGINELSQSTGVDLSKLIRKLKKLYKKIYVD